MKKQAGRIIAVAVAFLAGVAAYAAVTASNPFSSLKVYPNPWRADQHGTMLIKFEGMPAASTVKLFTVSGHEVKAFAADSNGNAFWDRKNDSGDLVASGIYLFVITDSRGNDTSGKLAIIK